MVETRTIVIVLALVIIAGGIYYYVQPGGSSGAEPSKNGTAILLMAVDKAAKVSTYVVVSGTSIDGAEPIVSTTIVKGLRARVDINDSGEVFRSFYFLQGEEYVCLPERGVCARVERNTTLPKLRNMMSYARGQVVKINETQAQDWVSRKIIDVAPGIVERQIAGRRCEEIKYRVHLDLLHAAELRGMGYDPAIVPFVLWEDTQCLDGATGFALYKLHNETLLDDTRVVKLNVSRFEPAAEVKESEFALDGGLVSEAEFLVQDDKEVERKSCLRLKGEDARQECFEERAVATGNLVYCDFIDSELGRDTCYMLLAQEWKDATKCENLTVLKEDCKYELALRLENVTLCGALEGADRRALCGTVLEENATACLPLVFADECAAALAGRLKNATICDQIKNETLRKNCQGE